MIKNILTMSVALLMNQSTFAAQDDTLPNGKTFTVLNDMVEANTALIEGNAEAIAINSASISILKEQAKKTSERIDGLEARMAANETDISNALISIDEHY